MKNAKTVGFIKNTIYALGAQGVSIMLSIILALVFPKLLGVHHYSYWRLFTMYIGYAYVAHLGLHDGVYLRNGGKDYGELNFSMLKSNMLISVVWQVVLGILMLLVTIGFFELEPERLFVIVCTAVYILISNVVTFLQYLMQATNRIKEYSGTVLVEKMCFLVVVIVGILQKCEALEVYVFAFFITRMMALGYCVWLCRDVIKCTCASWSASFQDVIANVSSGVNLMCSTFTNMLLLGIGQFMIDGHWGVEIFGMFSLALALSEFFVIFISQVSVVLFPEFKRMEKEALSNSYRALRNGLGVILLLAMLGYLPMYILVEVWMPQYEECLKYLVLLFPICVFDGKMGMLCNTYFKALRKERELLVINFFTMLWGALLYALVVFVLDNIFLVAICMTLITGLRSIVAEWYLAVLFGKDTTRMRVGEIILVVVFMTGTWFLGPLWGFILYLVAYVIFCASYKTQLLQVLQYGRLKG